jgi:hypothetical protein
MSEKEARSLSGLMHRCPLAIPSCHPRQVARHIKIPKPRQMVQIIHDHWSEHYELDYGIAPGDTLNGPFIRMGRE